MRTVLLPGGVPDRPSRQALPLERDWQHFGGSEMAPGGWRLGPWVGNGDPCWLTRRAPRPWRSHRRMWWVARKLPGRDSADEEGELAMHAQWDVEWIQMTRHLVYAHLRSDEDLGDARAPSCYWCCWARGFGRALLAFSPERLSPKMRVRSFPRTMIEERDEHWWSILRDHVWPPRL